MPVLVLFRALIRDPAAGIDPSASGPLAVVVVIAPASFRDDKNRICRSMLKFKERTVKSC